MSEAYGESGKGGEGENEALSGVQLAKPSHEQVALVSEDQVPSAFPPEPAIEHVAQVSADQVPSAFPTEPAKVHEAQVSADQVPPAFPPEPPPVLGHAGAVFLPDVGDLGDSMSSGSFSRVSAVNMSGFQLALELAMLEPEFPEVWEDAYVVPSLSSEVDAQGFLKDGLGSDGRSSPDPSWGSHKQGSVEARGDDPAMPRQEGSEVGSIRSRSERAGFPLQQAHAHDALGSFVGSLVKSDVARFGSSCSDQKLP